MSSLVETRGLTKRYEAVTALDDCTFEVSSNEICGLLGPNGAGKSTLLRLLLGLIRPSSGCATIDGLDCHRDAVAVHTRVAYLPGQVRLFARMTGREFLEFCGGFRDAGFADRAARLVARLDVDLRRRTGEMSTGTRQKLALASVLAIDAPLIILDEPTANLDPTVRQEVLALVREARRDGRTVLFSSHVLDEVETACERVIVLKAGKLVHTQCMHDLRRRHRIRARLAGPLTTPPPQDFGELAIEQRGDELTIVTPGELAPLLGWLATLPLTEVHVEPIGLAAVYERFHPYEATDSAAARLVGSDVA